MEMPARSTSRAHYGTTSTGHNVESFTLHAGSLTAKIITLGATLSELHVPDAAGKRADVVLGYATLSGYEACSAHVGCIVGRVANRIAGSTFELNGRAHRLPANIGDDHLHGGPDGFHRANWSAEVLDDACVRLTHRSPAGDAGYPGTLLTSVTYSLTESGLAINFHATSDAPTPVNLASHGYFNLAGSASGANVLDHELTVLTDKFVHTTQRLLPSGDVRSVCGTPLDFRTPQTIGANIEELRTQAHSGYDHSFALHDKPARELTVACTLRDPQSGRTMELATTQPCLQVYTSNFLGVPKGGKHGPLRRFQAVCLEAQSYPDAVHHAYFPTTILGPGETYVHRTEHRFSVT